MADLVNYQKVCDVYDFFNPEVLAFVRDDLKVEPSLRRRAWEFATIGLGLRQAGMLDGSKVGIGMGVGTERLIYALEKHVKLAYVTDLYQADSRWVAVRTEDPTTMLKARAPWPVDWNKLKAMRMDMRQLELADESVDFGWSTGAMEHIGGDEDFVRHFNEVARVLRPGGVYVFTTAIAYDDETVRFPNNYLFNPQHLLDLIERSNLHAAPLFDVRVGDHALNHPAYEDLSEFGLNVSRQASPHVVSFRRGVITTANCMVLRKQPQGARPPRVVGFEQTRRKLARQAETLLKSMWETPQSIRLTAADKEVVAPMMYFGKARVRFQAHGKARKMLVQSRSKGPNVELQRVAEANFFGGRSVAEVNCEADMIYKVTFPTREVGSLRLTAQRIA